MKAVLLFALPVTFTAANAQSPSPTNPIVGTGSTLSITSTSPGYTGAVVADNGITLYTNGSTTYTGATVSVSSGASAGDILGWNAGSVPGGVSANYNSTTQVLNFNGTASAAAYQALLRTVTINSNAAPSTNKGIAFSVAGGAIISYGTHYYEFVPGSITWANAKTGAAARNLNGLQGYLATITSAGENGFIATKLGSDGWIGGSDGLAQLIAAGVNTYSTQAQAEGHWYWVTGPETGMNISNGNLSPVTAPGAYANWTNAEPNDYNGGEHALEMYIATASWNDLPLNTLYTLGGYVTEYGGMPGDPAVSLTYTRSVLYTCSPVTTPAVTYSSTTACGGNNGSITATVTSNLTPPYKYSNNNDASFQTSSSTTYTFSNLATGSYIMIVRNGNNCPSVAQTVVVSTGAPTFTAATTAASCNGGTDGAATLAAAGGTAPYTYSIDNGVNYLANAGSFTGLAPGSGYSALVKDAGNCVSLPQALTVGQPLPLTFSTTYSNVLCNAAATGSITLTAAGGNGGYLYSKNGGPAQASNVLGGLAAGSYSVAVTDSKSCSSTPQSVTIGQPSAVTVVSTTVTPLYPMPGQEIQTIYTGYPGSAQAMNIAMTPSGGTAPYTYSMTRSLCNLATVDPGFSYSNDASVAYPFTPGTVTLGNNTGGDNIYTFKMTAIDANGCASAVQTKKVNVVNPYSGADVMVCHRNVSRGSTTTQMMTMAPSAVATHLAHGDYLGNCQQFIGARQVTAAVGDHGVHVYPNPATGSFKVELHEIMESADIIVTDVQGRIIARRTVSKDAPPVAEFDVAGVSAGIYLISVKDGEMMYRTKIVLR